MSQYLTKVSANSIYQFSSELLGWTSVHRINTRIPFDLSKRGTVELRHRVAPGETGSERQPPNFKQPGINHREFLSCFSCTRNEKSRVKKKVSIRLTNETLLNDPFLIQDFYVYNNDRIEVVISPSIDNYSLDPSVV